MRTLLLASWLVLGLGCGGDDAATHVDPDAAVCPSALQTGDMCPPQLEGRSCPIEGTGVCDQEPAGGTCTCSNLTWACSSGCADGCPTQAPTEGAACTLTAGTECRYRYPQMSRCTCNGSTFHCS